MWPRAKTNYSAPNKKSVETNFFYLQVIGAGLGEEETRDIFVLMVFELNVTGEHALCQYWDMDLSIPGKVQMLFSSSNLAALTESSVILLIIEEILPNSVMALYPTTVSKGSASCIPGDLSVTREPRLNFPWGYTISQ